VVPEKAADVVGIDGDRHFAVGASGSGNYLLVGAGGLRPTGAELLKVAEWSCSSNSEGEQPAGTFC
jgi:hypothetical protein